MKLKLFAFLLATMSASALSASTIPEVDSKTMITIKVGPNNEVQYMITQGDKKGEWQNISEDQILEPNTQKAQSDGKLFFMREDGSEENVSSTERWGDRRFGRHYRGFRGGDGRWFGHNYRYYNPYYYPRGYAYPCGGLAVSRSLYFNFCW